MQINELWIPVSKRLPSAEGEYIVTVALSESVPLPTRITKTCKFTPNFRNSFDFGEEIPAWYRDSRTGYPEDGETEYEHVVAWMPYPEPYNEQEVKSNAHN